MTKVFRGSLTVEFDADAVQNKHELAGQVEKLLNAGVMQFTNLGEQIKVGVVADYVRVPGPRAKKTDVAQTDLGAAVAAAGGNPGGPRPVEQAPQAA